MTTTALITRVADQGSIYGGGMSPKTGLYVRGASWRSSKTATDPLQRRHRCGYLDTDVVSAVAAPDWVTAG